MEINNIYYFYFVTSLLSLCILCKCKFYYDDNKKNKIENIQNIEKNDKYILNPKKYLVYV